MAQKYFRGNRATFYVTFLSADGGDNPTIINPKITIKHWDGVQIDTDVSSQDLIQIGSSNQYYFEWNIPSNADIADYLVTYNANVDGYDLEGDDTFQVVEMLDYAGGII